VSDPYDDFDYDYDIDFFGPDYDDGYWDQGEDWDDYEPVPITDWTDQFLLLKAKNGHLMLCLVTLYAFDDGSDRLVEQHFNLSSLVEGLRLRVIEYGKQLQPGESRDFEEFRRIQTEYYKTASYDGEIPF
jgi:hypothetical protein